MRSVVVIISWQQAEADQAAFDKRGAPIQHPRALRGAGAAKDFARLLLEACPRLCGHHSVASDAELDLEPRQYHPQGGSVLLDAPQGRVQQAAAGLAVVRLLAARERNVCCVCVCVCERLRLRLLAFAFAFALAFVDSRCVCCVCERAIAFAFAFAFAALRLWGCLERVIAFGFAFAAFAFVKQLRRQAEGL